MSKTFLDSNILLYALDPGDQLKQRQARQLILALTRTRSAVISTQVLQEFYVAAVAKLGADSLEVKDLISDYLDLAMVVITPALIFEAIDISVLNRVSFWDALIVASASSAGCGTLLTEDLSDGQTIAGVKVVNPFSA